MSEHSAAGLGEPGARAPSAEHETGRSAMHGGWRAFPANGLQLLGLLIAFVLIVAAQGFAAEHPALTATLVFAFSLPYLAASIATLRPHFLYATMLLGAASYFLACQALGAPATAFPLLSVPLVFFLLIVARTLSRRLPAGLASFPLTVIRAMNTTVCAFSLWALVQIGDLLGSAGLIRYAAGLAFLGYAVLYLLHYLGGASALYAYVFPLFLAMGAFFISSAAGAASWAWLAVLATAAVPLCTGTLLHGARTYKWSRHLYWSGSAVLVVSILLSVLQIDWLLTALALASLVLWCSYCLLARSVGSVLDATAAERRVARFFYFGALLMALPLALIVLLVPAVPLVARAAVVQGLVFAWIAWQRRGTQSGVRNAHVLGAALFAASGLCGLGVQIPGALAVAWLLVVPAVLIAAATVLHRACADAALRLTRRALPECTALPAFFAWYVPVLVGQAGLALACAATALAASLVAARLARDRRFLIALGPSAAGVVVTGAVLAAGHGASAWVACAVASAIAGLLAARAGRQSLPVPRAAAALAWLPLAAAAIALAVLSGDASQALYCVTAVGFSAVLLGGLARGRDAFDLLVAGVAFASVLAAVVLGPLSGLAPEGAGICLLALAVGCGAAWGLRRTARDAYAAQALFAFGTLLVIFGRFAAVESRLACGAALVAALFAIGSAARRRFPSMSGGAVVMGHLTGFALAAAALVQAWPQVSWALVLAVTPYVVLYALMPGLRRNIGLRLGTACWLSLLALFALAAGAGTPYSDQVPIVVTLSLVWAVVGYLLPRLGAVDWAHPLYVCAGMLATFCGGISLFTPPAAGSWQVFLVSGLVFALLFLILHHDIFAYLLTFSLSLMAYDWVKASTSAFTQDVLFYLVIGAGVLGVFFLLPHLKRFVSRLGVVPMFGIYTWRGAACVALPVFGAAVLVLSAYSVKITEHPRFCTSCHYMGDYYESWQHSSHADVACVKCHYEPGVESKMKGKMAGMLQLIKYVTHSYGTKPHAEISNSSCMRSGCHSDMNHSKETLIFRGKVRFRHDKHLDEHPRGKVLNCVSCHGQMVEGTHISVSETACVTCHFYGRGDQPVAAGECLTCHIVPEQDVTFADQSFSHQAFLEGKDAVDCTHCHSGVTQGDGRVSDTRCRSCHLNRVDPIEDQEAFHLVHVSEGHFDCLQCHDEISHGAAPMDEQMLTTADCRTCHGEERHTVQEQVYAGTAIAGMDAMPDVMYMAGVACNGCHTDMEVLTFGGATVTTRVSGAKQCSDCHAKSRYGDMLEAWQDDIRERLSELQATMGKLKKDCEEAEGDEETLAQARGLLASAMGKLAVVERDGSYGAHNYFYVTDILDSAESELSRLRTLARGWITQR